MMNQQLGFSSRSPYPLLLLLLIGLFFTANRVVPAYTTVLGNDNGVQLLGVDAYFHVRHANYTLHNFPDHLRYDPASHYPTVEYQEYSGLFNLGLAVATKLVQPIFPQTDAVSSTTPPLPTDSVSAQVPVLERVAAWSPVLLGILSFVVLSRLAFLLWGPWASVLSALIYTLFPGYSLSRTTLGFADQHAAEIFLAIATLFGLVRCIQTAASPGVSSPESAPLSQGLWRTYRPAMLYSLPLAAFCFTWIGYPMYIAFSGVVMLVLTVVGIATSPSSEQIKIGLFQFFSGVLCWQVVVLVLFPSWRMQWVPHIYTYSMIAMGCCAVVPLLFFGAVSRISLTAQHRWWTALFLGLLLVTILFLFFTKSSMGSGFWYWLTYERDQSVLEQQAFSISRYVSMYGAVGFVALLAPFLVIVTKEDGKKRVLAVTLIVFSLLCVGIWARTHDFDYVPGVFIALMATYSIRCFGVLLAGRPRLGPTWEKKRPVLRTIGIAVLAMGLIFPVWPLHRTRTPWIHAKEVQALLIYDSSWLAAMDWFKAHSPEEDIDSFTNDPKKEPYPASRYGVVSAWDHGNIIAYRAGRLPLYSRYPTAGDAIWMTAIGEQDALAKMCPSCANEEKARFAVVSYRLASDLFLSKASAAGRNVQMQQVGLWNRDGKQIPRITFGPVLDQSLINQMFKYNGSGLEQHRLIYESPERHLVQTVYDPTIPELRITSDPLPPDIDPPQTGNSTLTQVGDLNIYDVYAAPSIRIFEVVKGAFIEGRSLPNDRILVRNQLISAGSLGPEAAPYVREYAYEQVLDVDSTGAFTFRLPYPTDAGSREYPIYTKGPFQIISQKRGRYSPIFLTSTNVAQGDTLRAHPMGIVDQ